ncbi:Bax inhibitor-1/YccA family protein [Actinophytocola sp.]|uniref:Bax inhibitor-1/YccA family protein n=1 Tax=Actinophytocola sp. TaxID=1872138 RepID=UPI002D3DDA75|nr:Bax inhibitor-1/YccA family protein [Actinophytocola sp.]HYQ62300.1 Bax inhibitor-1/YccA family protein [Actinophytocola sp.]
MRSTSNPAFRNLPRGGGLGGGYAGFQTQPQGAPGYGGYQAPPTTSDRPMTVDDVVTKTAITVGLALVVGIITGIAVYSGTISPFPPLIIGLIAGLVLSLIVIFKQTPNPALVLSYSAAEGLFLGAITGVFSGVVEGIALQAIMATALVFIVMLVVYKTGAVKVTPKLTKGIIGATVAAGALMLINLIMSFFGFNPLRDGGTLSIIFSIVVIGIAAFNFLLDFDMADQMIRSGMPSKWAWYAAFGLMTTLVWLYLEILRLLYYLNQE